MSSNTAPLAPRLAATLLILRDAPAGLEVLMVLRHEAVDFASGALVFPGGKLAAGDSDSRVTSRCSGIDGLSSEQIALRVGAIREAFEESGLLLARARGSDAMLDPGRATELGLRYRQALDSGAIGIADMLEAEDLVLACEALVPFAHWITPVYAGKRFDTYFYLSLAPPEQVALHDGKEMVDSHWITPGAALAAEASGTRKIVTATRLNLRKLNASSTAAEAITAARGSPIVTVLPEIVERAHGRVLVIPETAGYGVTELPLAH